MKQNNANKSLPTEEYEGECGWNWICGVTWYEVEGMYSQVEEE